jgi:hypothetical protein
MSLAKNFAKKNLICTQTELGSEFYISLKTRTGLVSKKWLTLPVQLL